MRNGKAHLYVHYVIDWVILIRVSCPRDFTIENKDFLLICSKVEVKVLLQVQGHLIVMIVHVMLDTYVHSRLLFLAIYQLCSPTKFFD